MNLKTRMAVAQHSGPNRRRIVNRCYRRRRRRLPRHRLRRSRLTRLNHSHLWNDRMPNGARPHRKGFRFRRRCRHPSRNYRTTPAGLPNVSAIVLPATGKPATSCRSQSRSRSSRRSSFTGSLAAGYRLCGAKNACSGQYWSPNEATLFIDHSSEMWNFHRDRVLIRCPC
jgi:hypothetical protein